MKQAPPTASDKLAASVLSDMRLKGEALALQAGLAKGSRLFTKAGQQELSAAVMSPAMQWQCEHWLQLLQPLNQQLLETMTWCKAASKGDVCISRLRTHPGIGLFTSHFFLRQRYPFRVGF